MAVFCAALLPAQKVGGKGPAVGVQVGVSRGEAGHRAGAGPMRPGGPQRPGEARRYYGTRRGGIWLPWSYPGWGYDDLYWNLPSFYEEPAPQSAPQPVVVEGRTAPAATGPIEPPKVIELAAAPEASASKPLPPTSRQAPTVFVLKNGERIESRFYLLSVQSLQVEVGTEKRTIPVSSLNLDATIANNRLRGIDLSFPHDSNTVFLGF